MDINKYRLPDGIVRAVSGLVEAASTEPYRTYIAEASEVVGRRIDDQSVRADLISAIMLNVINRKEYPFEMLARHYGLPVSHGYFKREKYLYVYRVAELCGFVGENYG